MDFSMEETNMAKRILLVFSLALIVTVGAHGQQYPYLKYVRIHCVTAHGTVNQMFYYTYLVTNPKSNSGRISQFEIDISRYSDQMEFDTLGLIYKNDGFTEGAFRRHYPALQGRIIPVGFPSGPAHWLELLSNNLTVTFAGYSPMIEPGDSLGGFVMMSHGLPGIRRFIASPDFDPTQYLPNPDEYPDSAVNVDSLERTLNYYGYTIGPTAPPLDFSASLWLDTLISYKHQCITLGWLIDKPEHEKDGDNDKANEGIVEKLDRRLDKAKDALTKGDSVKARQELELFVKEVEHLYGEEEKGERSKEKGKEVLTSEGYALLKYNAEYLIDRLPEKHEKGDEGEHRDKK